MTDTTLPPGRAEIVELLEWDWAVTSFGMRLHHVAEVNNAAAFYEMRFGTGRSTCGRYTVFHIPGLFERMDAHRCSRCCDRLGMPRGIGSPKNTNELRPLVEQRLAALQARESEVDDG